MLKRLPCYFLLLCFAGTFAVPSAKADEQDDHDALRKLAGIYEQTIKESKPELLKPHLADDFTGVMVTAEEVDGFESLDAYWKKIQGLLGDGGTYSVKVNIPQPAEIIGDMAFAHGTTDDIAITSAGTEYHFSGRWTAVCRKEEDNWKIVRIHGSMDPIANSFVAATVKGASYAAGGTGIALGLVAGICLTILVRRRRSTTDASQA